MVSNESRLGIFVSTWDPSMFLGVKTPSVLFSQPEDLVDRCLGLLVKRTYVLHRG
jgi:hypothetical protein